MTVMLLVYRGLRGMNEKTENREDCRKYKRLTGFEKTENDDFHFI